MSLGFQRAENPEPSEREARVKSSFYKNSKKDLKILKRKKDFAFSIVESILLIIF